MAPNIASSSAPTVTLLPPPKSQEQPGPTADFTQHLDRARGAATRASKIEPVKKEIASKPKSTKTAKSHKHQKGRASTATTTPEDSDAADVKDTSELSNAADTEISPQPETQTPVEPSVKPIDAPSKAAQVGALAACKNQVLIDGTAALPAHREASGLAQPLTTSTAAPATPAAVDPTSTPESAAAKISEESATPQSIKLPPSLKSTPKQVESSPDGSSDDVPESLAIQPTPKVVAASPSNPAANVSGGEAAPASVDATKPLAEVVAPADDLRNVAGLVPQLHAPSPAAHGSTPASRATAAPQMRFAEANHAGIVQSVRANLLPNGGSMHIRLDPPELGALQVTVEMRDGSLNATFQTSNDDATRLLSHSLGQLKTALESQGVTVDKLQVQQAPKDQHTPSGEDRSPQQGDQQNARQDQQRKELLARMWRRLSIGSDPIDLVA